MTPSFPTSKIEIHQWFNSLLLGVVIFFVVQTYNTITKDHEVIANHETRISVVESRINNKQSAMRFIEAILPDELKMKGKK